VVAVKLDIDTTLEKSVGGTRLTLDVSSLAREQMITWRKAIWSDVFLYGPAGEEILYTDLSDAVDLVAGWDTYDSEAIQHLDDVHKWTSIGANMVMPSSESLVDWIDERLSDGDYGHPDGEPLVDHDDLVLTFLAELLLERIAKKIGWHWSDRIVQTWEVWTIDGAVFTLDPEIGEWTKYFDADGRPV
jgi:hypothetical protein